MTPEAQEEEEADFEDAVIRNIAREQLEGDVDWGASKVEDQWGCNVETVKAVPRLAQDLAAMLELMKSDTPVMVVLRPVRGAAYLAYGFVDASGEGFGGTLQAKLRNAQNVCQSARL